MTSELVDDMTNELKETKGMSVSLKLFIALLVFIINVETVSFLVLHNDAVITVYQKALSLIVLILSFVFFIKWKKTDRYCFLFFILLLVKLVIQSLIGFGSLLIYPSILAVIFPFLYVYFIKDLFKRLNIDVFNILIAFIFIGYFVFMLCYGREFNFSNAPLAHEGVGPFAGDTRILHANSILLIQLPFLVFLNKIISERRTYLSIAGFVTSLLIILIHQHRTVWLTTILSSLLLLFMKGFNKELLKRLLFFVLLISGIFVLLVFAIPGFNQLLLERFMDVFDPLNEDNTGGFRYLQILAYLNYFTQKPLFGWTFNGFELSNPFLTDNWEEDSGHHFHNAYIEVLFYFGISGLLLKFYPLFSIAKRIKQPLSERSKVLTAFCVSGILYSFSYVPPLIFWGIVGLCLYNIERDFKQHQFQIPLKK